MATLEEIYKKWSYRENYGFAMDIQHHVGKGNSIVDYAFGMALMNGSQPGTKLFLKGLWWIENSLGFWVKYPQHDETYENHCVMHVNGLSLRRFEFKGLYFFRTGFVLAPSPAVWREFKEENLSNPHLASPNIDIVDYNPEIIKTLANRHEICSLSEWHSEEAIAFNFTDKYEGTRKRIVISPKTYKVIETVIDQEYQCLINFVEKVLVTTGSWWSVIQMLRAAGCKHVF